MASRTPGYWTSGTMTMTAKHWASLGKGTIHIVKRGCDVIAAVWCGDDDDGEEEANAAFIVRACNAHDELVEALEAMLAAENAETLADGFEQMRPAKKLALAALAKAKGSE